MTKRRNQKRCKNIKINENGCPNLYDDTKTVGREIYCTNAYFKKIKSSQPNLKTAKSRTRPEVSKTKEITTIRAEINEIATRIVIGEINKRVCFS